MLSASTDGLNEQYDCNCAQSGHAFLCLRVPRIGCSYYRGSVARILILGTLQIFRNQYFFIVQEQLDRYSDEWDLIFT